MRYLRHFKYYICRVLAKLNLLQHFSFHLTQKYSGHKFRIPVINDIGYYNLFPIREEWIDTIIKNYTKKETAI